MSTRAIRYGVLAGAFAVALVFCNDWQYAHAMLTAPVPILVELLLISVFCVALAALRPLRHRANSDPLYILIILLAGCLTAWTLLDAVAQRSLLLAVGCALYGVCAYCVTYAYFGQSSATGA